MTVRPRHHCGIVRHRVVRCAETRLCEVETMSDNDFAARMMAARNGNVANGRGKRTMSVRNDAMTKGLFSDPEDSDSYRGSYNPDKPFKSRKRKTSRRLMEDMEFSPKDFEGCDLNILDRLDIEVWDKFKVKLITWNISEQVPEDFIESRSIRGI